MYRLAVVTTALFTMAAAPAFAQSCPTHVAGESMARMIGEAGGANKLHKMALAQVAEFDRWFAELKKSQGKGIREAEIETLRKQAVEAQKANREIAEAARCYMG